MRGRWQYIHTCAALFIASGCLLGALLGLTYDLVRNRRTAGG